jgi:PAS domain S-box-containing protein
MATDDPLNVLLVDDQPAKLLTYESILGDLGENLLKAHSAREALSLLLERDIAIVVMDVSMPDIDGFELAALIRQHPRCERTAIIFVSAVHVSDLDRLKGYETGALDYLPVPIVPQMLRAKIRVLADLHRKTRQLARLNEELERRVEQRTEALARSAERLRHSEARFRSLAEGMRHIVWEADARGEATYLSPRWYAYTGEADGSSLAASWLDAIHPDDRERARAARDAAISSRGAFPLDYEVRLRRRDGVYRWFEVTGESVQRGDGRIEKWVGTSVDIEERKRAEDSLREADRRKDEFLAMLAHELRNPLAPIHNALRLLEMPEAGPDVADWSRGVIVRQVGQLTRLVEELLDISRVTRGRIQLQLERADLASILEGAVETSRPLIDSRGHTLHLTLPEERVEIRCDRVRLIQVVANLLNNAAKFQANGGWISASAERAGSEVVIRVRDRGVGIETDSLESIFELFAQGRGGSESGLGIGLSLVRTLVELHGGKVVARSEGLGHGSEFIVRLPGLEPEELDDPARGAPAGDPGPVTPLRILVVDDNRDSADSLARVLRVRGHESVACFSGEAALDELARVRPDAVLLDLSMPGIDGFEVQRRIRAGEHRDALVVAITGRGSDAHRERALAGGFDALLVKPVDPAQIAELVEQRAAPRARDGAAAERRS